MRHVEIVDSSTAFKPFAAINTESALQGTIGEFALGVERAANVPGAEFHSRETLCHGAHGSPWGDVQGRVPTALLLAFERTVEKETAVRPAGVDKVVEVILHVLAHGFDIIKGEAGIRGLVVPPAVAHGIVVVAGTFDVV